MSPRGPASPVPASLGQWLGGAPPSPAPAPHPLAWVFRNREPGCRSGVRRALVVSVPARASDRSPRWARGVVVARSLTGRGSGLGRRLCAAGHLRRTRRQLPARPPRAWWAVAAAARTFAPPPSPRGDDARGPPRPRFSQPALGARLGRRPWGPQAVQSGRGGRGRLPPGLQPGPTLCRVPRADPVGPSPALRERSRTRAKLGEFSHEHPPARQRPVLSQASCCGCSVTCLFASPAPSHPSFLISLRHFKANCKHLHPSL